VQTAFALADRTEGDRASWRAVSVGAAAEFGLREGLSLQVEWLPGYTLWSTLLYPDRPTFPNDDANRTGAHDLWAAARVQILGPAGVAGTPERLLLVVAPGMVVPFPEPDWERERDRAVDEKRYVFETPDRHAVGIGARAEVETMLYPSFGLRGGVAYVQFLEKEAGSFAAPTTQLDVDYGYELTIVVEPHGILDTGRLIWEAGLKATHVIRPETLVDEVVAVNDAYALSVEPWVGVTLAARQHPLALSVGYEVPLAERNADGEHALRVTLSSASIPRR
jgi:hypothetical protein